MADTVSTQILLDGPRHAVVKITNLSDGTGESAVAKVTASSLSGAPATVNVERVHYNVNGMVATLLWDATTDDRMLELSGYGTFDFSHFKGLTNPKSTGYTGNILLTTTGHSAGDSYSIVLELLKQ